MVNWILRRDWLLLVPLAWFGLAGCSTTGTTAPAPLLPLNLPLYATATVPLSPTFTPAASPPPVPTSTPVIHIIVAGDTLSSLALHYNLTLAELLAANPGIQPQALVVGQTLQIPAAGSVIAALPTPAAVTLGQVSCFPSGGGLFCLLPLQGSDGMLLENVRVQILLLDASGQVRASQEALLPLNSLPAGKTLPALAFFPGLDTASGWQARVLTAIQPSTAESRYLDIQVQNLLVGIDWGGRSATVQGQVALPAGASPARVIWLAGVAYDAQGRPVGARRWEWAGMPPADGAPLPFSFSLYSAGPPIARVEVLAEARP